MKRPYQITGILFLIFAALVIRESLELRFYTRLGPGPGFFPFWLGCLVALMAAIMLCQATFRLSDPMPADFFPPRAGYLRMGTILLAMSGTVVLMKPFGFRLTILAFLLALLLGLGRQRLILTLVIALIGSFGTYHAFVEWLKVPLPVGLLGI